MPYISQTQRNDLKPLIEPLCDDISMLSAGEVNYLITRIVDSWVGGLPRYDRLNEAVGVLECAKLELYRELVAPYEDTKLLLNGPVLMDRS